MLLRTVSLAAIGLLLSSCQPATYDIIAHLRGADLVFEARGSGSWPFRNEDGISAEWIEVRDRDRLVWALQLDPDQPACKPVGKTPPFPLVYGRIPECYIAKLASRPLSNGTLYEIAGEGFRSGQGYFKLSGEAANFEWSEVEREIRSWPVLADPRLISQPKKSIPAAPAAAESSATSK